MRVGLRGPVRKGWAPRGVPTGWSYLYLAVALDPRTGQLWWPWPKNMKSEERARIRGAWAKESDMQALAAPRVVPPPYAPERNPMERFFRELHRALEGHIYPDLQAKQEALEPIPKAWQADPKRVRQRCGWCWIREALKALPAATQAA